VASYQRGIKLLFFTPYLIFSFNQLLASCSYDDTIKLWADQDDDWYCIDTMAGHNSTVWEIAFDSTGDRLVSCSDDKTIIIWKNYPDAAGIIESSTPRNIHHISHTSLCIGRPKFKNVCTLSGYHTRCIYSVDWSASGMIASAAGDDSLRIFAQVKRIPYPLFLMPERGIMHTVATTLTQHPTTGPNK